MIQEREQQSHKHHEESYPLFMSQEQLEQLIRNKFARAVHHYSKFQGENYVRSKHTGNILQNR